MLSNTITKVALYGAKVLEYRVYILQFDLGVIIDVVTVDVL